MLQVLFVESEMILFLTVVVFLMKKLLDFIGSKCGKSSFELMSIKFLVTLKRFFLTFF